MKLGVLFSGGKDSCYATWLAQSAGHEIACLITLESKNKDSFMFHTPSILCVEKQAEVMGVPLINFETEGEKEVELKDLKSAIKIAIDKYKIEGVVTGAVESVYQSSRIQKICDKLRIDCFNPLWQKNQIELLQDLIRNKFKVLISGVAAEGLDEKWIGKKIDENFVKEILKLKKEFKINPAGEGGEYESLVVNCPLFERKLKVIDMKVLGSGNNSKGEFELK
jgi:diphthine-ammonia ligase